jgi:hypothetical protein
VAAQEILLCWQAVVEKASKSQLPSKSPVFWPLWHLKYEMFEQLSGWYELINTHTTRKIYWPLLLLKKLVNVPILLNQLLIIVWQYLFLTFLLEVVENPNPVTIYKFLNALFLLLASIVAMLQVVVLWAQFYYV